MRPIVKPIPLSSLAERLQAHYPTALALTSAIPLSKPHAYSILSNHLTEWTPSLCRKLNLELLLKHNKQLIPIPDLPRWLAEKYGSGIALAKAANITPPAATRILRGVTKIPNDHTLRALGLEIWVRSSLQKA